jgi:hypothetical protein
MNLITEYKTIFNSKKKHNDEKKEFISLLNCFTERFYFINQLFDLDSLYSSFVIYTETIAPILAMDINETKISEYI